MKEQDEDEGAIRRSRRRWRSKKNMKMNEQGEDEGARRW